MALEQQWQEDVRFFGELAYLMWEVSLIDDKRQRFSEIFPRGNLTVITNMLEPDVFILRRKQSAALPFDLVAALAGDGVEYIAEGWIEYKTFPSVRNIKCVNNDFVIGIIEGSATTTYLKPSSLRMKHPRRLGVEY